MNQERELGWDDEIEKDGSDFILLPAGDYNFTVTKFERGRFAGSAKMPACNQAKLELKVQSPEHGDVTIFHTLLLHTKTEGFLSNFFAGIGQKKKGEKLRMNWNTVIGSKGKLKLKTNKFIGKDGVEKTNNEVQTFYSYEEAFPQGQAQQGYQQPTQGYQQPQQQYQQQQQPMQQTPFPTNNNGFVPGQF
ncbi:hypothetical protein J1P26_19915 [Neobacillus sp. MM2021_6]|nr:hypothetical protein [Neobacillus sp. MM2021_6]NHC20328.1 hypothetical protein [Bacillus sp. MM2020_4]